MLGIFNWFLHVTGSDDTSGLWYGFWSGFGSDITEFGIVFYLWHRINCPVRGCWRVGVHKVPGTNHVVCGKHHPSGKRPKRLSYQDVLDFGKKHHND